MMFHFISPKKIKKKRGADPPGFEPLISRTGPQTFDLPIACHVCETAQPMCQYQCSNSAEINGCPTDNQVTISGCPPKFLVVHTFMYTYKGDFGLQIYGCPLGNCISIFGCPATVLVVPGAWTTKILNAGQYPYRPILLIM